MTDNQKGIMTIAYELAAMSYVLKTNLTRSYGKGHGVQAQDVARCTELHNKAVKLQEIAEGSE